MKILKKGRPNKPWSIDIKCTGHGNGGNGCGAKLRVEAEDLYQTRSTQMDGDFDLFITCTCACCGTLNDIDENKVPIEVRYYGLKRKYPDEAKAEWRNKYFPEETDKKENTP